LVIVAVWFPVPTLIVYCNICVVASVDLGNPLALRQRPGNRLDSREWHHVNLCAVLWYEALRESHFGTVIEDNGRFAAWVNRDVPPFGTWSR
jgi:hypothetical protein